MKEMRAKVFVIHFLQVHLNNKNISFNLYRIILQLEKETANNTFNVS